MKWPTLSRPLESVPACRRSERRLREGRPLSKVSSSSEHAVGMGVDGQEEEEKRSETNMTADRLPELLRGLGVEPFLDDAATLQRLADVAWDLARRAAAASDTQGYRRELEVFEWCTQRLSLLESDVFELAAAGSRRRLH